MLRRRNHTIVNDAGTLFLCKRNCDARYPFNRTRRQQCKYECEVAETVEALSQIGEVTTVTTSEGTQITNVTPTTAPTSLTQIISPVDDRGTQITTSISDEEIPTTPYENGRISPSETNKYILPIGLAIGAVVVYKILSPSKKRKKR